MGGLVELPSGTVDPGESIDKALKREVFEETGLIITSIDSYINHFDYLSNSGKITRQLNFYVRTQNKEVHLEVSEHSEFYWLEKTNLIKYNISQETKDSVIKALAII